MVFDFSPSVSCRSSCWTGTMEDRCVASSGSQHVSTTLAVSTTTSMSLSPTDSLNSRCQSGMAKMEKQHTVPMSKQRFRLTDLRIQQTLQFYHS